MRKYSFVIILISIFLFRSIAEPLIDEEIYYDAEEKEIIGKKKYIYNSKNNIIAIFIYNGKKLESKLEYIYLEDRLLVCEEYIGETTRIKYSIFSYNSQTLVDKKIEYDMDGNVIIVHQYMYSDKGYLITVKDYNDENVYVGEKKYIYKNDRLIEEQLFDDKNRMFIKKEYEYDDNLIKKVVFYTDKGIKIRVIKKYYSNIDGENSASGYRANFYDYR